MILPWVGALRLEIDWGKDDDAGDGADADEDDIDADHDGARVPETSLAGWHHRPEIFCASGKFLRTFTKLPIKCSLNINWTEE